MKKNKLMSMLPKKGALDTEKMPAKKMDAKKKKKAAPKKKEASVAEYMKGM